MKRILIFLLFSLLLIAQAQAAKVQLVLDGTVIATFPLPSGYDCDNFRQAPGYGDFLEDNGCYNNDGGHRIWCLDGLVTAGGGVGSTVPNDAILLPPQKATLCNCINVEGKSFQVDCPSGNCEACCKEQGGTMVVITPLSEGDCITVKGERRQSPIIRNITFNANVATIDAVGNYQNMAIEYSIDGVNWQNGNAFRLSRTAMNGFVVHVRYVDGQCEVTQEYKPVRVGTTTAPTIGNTLPTFAIIFSTGRYSLVKSNPDDLLKTLTEYNEKKATDAEFVAFAVEMQGYTIDYDNPLGADAINVLAKPQTNSRGNPYTLSAGVLDGLGDISERGGSIACNCKADNTGAVFTVFCKAGTPNCDVCCKRYKSSEVIDRAIKDIKGKWYERPRPSSDAQTSIALNLDTWLDDSPYVLVSNNPDFIERFGADKKLGSQQATTPCDNKPAIVAMAKSSGPTRRVRGFNDPPNTTAPTVYSTNGKPTNLLNLDGIPVKGDPCDFNFAVFAEKAKNDEGKDAIFYEFFALDKAGNIVWESIKEVEIGSVGKTKSQSGIVVAVNGDKMEFTFDAPTMSLSIAGTKWNGNSWSSTPPAEGTTIFYPDENIEKAWNNGGTLVGYAGTASQTVAMVEKGDILSAKKNDPGKGIRIDTAIVIRWPDDFEKAGTKPNISGSMLILNEKGEWKTASVTSVETFEIITEELVRTTRKALIIIPQIQTATTLTTVSFTKKGETEPTYKMQIVLPAGVDLNEMFKKSDQAEDYTIRIEGTRTVEAAKETLGKKNELPFAFPFFDAEGELLCWATKDGVVLTFARVPPSVKGVVISKNLFSSTYKSLSEELPKFRQLAAEVKTLGDLVSY